MYTLKDLVEARESYRNAKLMYREVHGVHIEAHAHTLDAYAHMDNMAEVFRQAERDLYDAQHKRTYTEIDPPLLMQFACHPEDLTRYEEYLGVLPEKIQNAKDAARKYYESMAAYEEAAAEEELCYQKLVKVQSNYTRAFLLFTKIAGEIEE